MSSNGKNWTVFFASLGAGLLGSWALLNAVATTDDSVRETLRFTARVAFLLLLIVFVARPAQQLFRTPFTAKLLRRRRLLGIAFTGMHTAHLLLIFYRTQINADFVLATNNIPGAIVYLFIYAMFATSFDTTTRMLGPKNWKRLHTIGLYVIFVAFAQDEIPRSLDSAESAHWIITALAVAALLLRVLPLLKRRGSPRSMA